MNKGITIGLLICLLFNLLTCSCTAAETTAQVDLVLTGIGVLDEMDLNTYPEEQTITRGELARYICKLAGIDIKISTGSAFADIEEHPDYSSIATLEAAGIVSGYAADLFYPAEKAQYVQLIKMIVALLGREPEAEIRGGYPNGYFAVADTAGITKGISAGMESPVTFGLLKAVMYNALDANVAELQPNGIGGYEVSETNTLLAERLHLEKTSGVMTANAYTTLTENTGVGAGMVQIGNLIFVGADEDTARLIGQNVTAYYEPETMELQVVYANSKNQQTEIKADVLDKDNPDFSESRIIYFQENGRTASVKIDMEADVLYNGAAFPSFSSEAFKIDTGSLILLDNDGDHVIEVVSIHTFANWVVESVDQENQTIYGKNGQKLELDAVEYIDIRDNFGLAIELSEIKEWDLLNVYMSKSGSCCEIVLIYDLVTGPIEGISTNVDGKTVLVIDGETFVVADSYFQAEADGHIYAPMLQIGQEGSFYLDADEKVASVRLDITGIWRYGYMINAVFSVEDTESVIFKLLFDNKGAKRYFSADKVILDGVRLDPAKLYSALTGGTNAVEPQLVRVKLNPQNQVIGIDTAAVEQDDGFNDTLEKDIDYTEQYYSITSGRMGIGESLGIKIDLAKNNIFLAPAKDSTYEQNKYNEDYYRIISTPFNNNNKFFIDAYDVEYDGTPGAVVVYANRLNETSNDGNTTFVEQISTVLNAEDEVCIQMSGYKYTGDRVEYIFSEENDAALIQEIEQGDVIRYSLDPNNEIEDCEVLFDRSAGLEYDVAAKIYNSNLDYSSAFTVNARNYLAKTVLAGKQGSYIKTLVPGVALTEAANRQLPLNDTQIFDAGSADILLFDGNRVAMLSPDDLQQYLYTNNQECRVLIYTTYTQLQMVAIYQ